MLKKVVPIAVAALMSGSLAFGAQTPSTQTPTKPGATASTAPTSKTSKTTKKSKSRKHRKGSKKGNAKPTAQKS